MISGTVALSGPYWFNSGSLSCPEGTFALSGGFYSTASGFRVLASADNPADAGWTFIFKDDIGNSPYTVNIYVVCG